MSPIPNKIFHESHLMPDIWGNKTYRKSWWLSHPLESHFFKLNLGIMKTQRIEVKIKNVWNQHQNKLSSKALTIFSRQILFFLYIQLSPAIQFRKKSPVVLSIGRSSGVVRLHDVLRVELQTWRVSYPRHVGMENSALKKKTWKETKWWIAL